MEKFNSIDEILDFAINNEQEAADFYTRLSESTNNQAVKKVFLKNAAEEMGHKAKLTQVKERGEFSSEFPNGVRDLKISDYVVPVTPNKITDYAEALRLAMHREKGAYKLYLKLSEQTSNPDIKKLFLRLADEEASHKLKFELEYDEFVYKEN